MTYQMTPPFQPRPPTNKSGQKFLKWLLRGLVLLVVVLLALICYTLAILLELPIVVGPSEMPTPTVVTPGPTVTLRISRTPTPNIPTSPTPPVLPTVVNPHPDDFIMANFGSAGTFDPAINYETAGQSILQNTYETLVTYNREDASTLVPQLASEWQVSDEGRTYIFTIRSGITFHEGGELTAEDVAYSFQRGLFSGGPDSPQILFTEPFFGVGIHHITLLVDPNDSSLHLEPARLKRADPAKLLAACERVKSAITADGNTVTMRLAQSWSPFLATLAGGWGSIMDKEWVIEHGGWDGDCATWQNFYPIPEEESPFHSLINGTGPYKLERGEPGGDEVVLVANENYWRNGLTELTGPAWLGGPVGTPAIQRIAFKWKDADTSLDMLRKGDADYALVSPENITETDSLVGEHCQYNANTHDFNCALTDNPSGQLRLYTGYFLAERRDALFVFNINTEGGNPFIGSGQLDGEGIPPNFFSDIHVRRAFNYCFDWQAYIDEEYSGEAEQVVGPIIPGLIGYNQASPKYSLDLNKCAQELKSAWSGQVAQNGFHMQLLDGLIAENLRDNLAKVDSSYVIELIEIDKLPEYYEPKEDESWSSFIGRLENEGRLPIVMSGWSEDVHDPHNWAHPFLVGLEARIQRFGQELVAEFAELVDAGAVETDPNKRQEIYEQLAQLDYDHAIAIRLAVPFGHRYEQRWVKGWYYNPIYPDFYYYALQK